MASNINAQVQITVDMIELEPLDERSLHHSVDYTEISHHYLITVPIVIISWAEGHPKHGDCFAYAQTDEIDIAMRCPVCGAVLMVDFGGGGRSTVMIDIYSTLTCGCNLYQSELYHVFKDDYNDQDDRPEYGKACVRERIGYCIRSWELKVDHEDPLRQQQIEEAKRLLNDWEHNAPGWHNLWWVCDRRDAVRLVFADNLQDTGLYPAQVEGIRNYPFLNDGSKWECL